MAFGPVSLAVPAPPAGTGLPSSPPRAGDSLSDHRVLFVTVAAEMGGSACRDGTEFRGDMSCDMPCAGSPFPGRDVCVSHGQFGSPGMGEGAEPTVGGWRQLEGEPGGSCAFKSLSLCFF